MEYQSHQLDAIYHIWYSSCVTTMEKTTVYISADTRRALEELSRRTGRSRAELLREALEEYLRRQGRPQLRSLGLGDNPEVSGRNAKAWLKDNWRPR